MRLGTADLAARGFGEQPQALRDGRADVGLLLCPFDDHGLDSEPLLTEPLLAALAAADPMAARTRLGLAGRRLAGGSAASHGRPAGPRAGQAPVLVENWATGLTWDFDTAMIGARVRRAGLQAAGDRGVVACAAGAVLRVQGRGDTRTPARGHGTAPGDPEAALGLE